MPPAPPTLTCPTRRPHAVAKGHQPHQRLGNVAHQAGMASLRHTSRLRKNTGHQRPETRAGARGGAGRRGGGGWIRCGGGYVLSWGWWAVAGVLRPRPMRRASSARRVFFQLLGQQALIRQCGAEFGSQNLVRQALQGVAGFVAVGAGTQDRVHGWVFAPASSSAGGHSSGTCAFVLRRRS